MNESGEENRTGLIRNIPNTSRKRGANNAREGDEQYSVTHEAIMDALNDVHQEMQDQHPSGKSKQREKELARWIKRCQEECKRQRK